MVIDENKINELDQKHAPAERFANQKIGYGTAGFRTHGDALDRVCYRVGLVTAIRACETGAAGVMITASHNSGEDNGVKIIDNDGYMVAMSWEDIFTQITQSDNLYADFTKLIQDKDIKFSDKVRVMIACDTRNSSPRLMQALTDGIEATGVKVKNFQQLTTPQLHFLIWYANKGKYTPEEIDEMSEETYYEYYRKNIEEYFKLINKEGGTTKYQQHLIIDTANGIGGPQLKKLDFIINSTAYGVDPVILNDGSNGVENLNKGCGAECVHKERKFPAGAEEIKCDEHTKWASFDGDADRIVYYYGDPKTNDLNVVDGDKIAILLGDYIKSLMDNIYNDKNKLSDLISFAVVQTGYANSAATNYLTDKEVKVDKVPTGVKHLHHKAAEYDIGVYFEANGHGTVITKYDKIVQTLKDNGFKIEEPAVNKFLKFLLLTNEAVGDAMATLLMMEAYLKDTDMTIQLVNNIYLDLPSKMMKSKVKDRTIFVTHHTDETQLLQPEGLQDVIEGTFKHLSSCRAFVRPSGTEDVVRIYAEAPTQDQADELATKIAGIIEKDYMA